MIKPGMHNSDAGPDFLDARLSIGGTLWAGNVEVHVRASDWMKHKHHLDKAYDNVILHVVYHADEAIRNGEGQTIPALNLQGLFDYQAWRNYRTWLKQDGFIACEGMIADVPDLVKAAAVEASAISRLQDKSANCLDHLRQSKGNVEEVFYRLLCRSMGLKVNAMPMEQLALSTPLSLLRKCGQDEMDLQALLLGQAGFLSADEAPRDSDFVSELQERYAFFVRKYQVRPMPSSAWKLFRLRPQNFPQLRLAQLARFYSERKAVVQYLLDASNLDAIRKIFSLKLDHPFWRKHYTLKHESPEKTKALGKNAVDLIIINAVIPFLFALSRYNESEETREKALGLLEELPPENNRIIRGYKELGFSVKSGFDSQGLIHLKKFACDSKKCLTCKVGTHILNRDVA